MKPSSFKWFTVQKCHFISPVHNAVGSTTYFNPVIVDWAPYCGYVGQQHVVCKTLSCIVPQPLCFTYSVINIKHSHAYCVWSIGFTKVATEKCHTNPICASTHCVTCQCYILTPRSWCWAVQRSSPCLSWWYLQFQLHCCWEHDWFHYLESGWEQWVPSDT